MSNPENLVPFKKGQSGNPGGRPKGRSVVTPLRDFGKGKTNSQIRGLAEGALDAQDRVAARLWLMALEGSDQTEAGTAGAGFAAMKEILDRLDGKSTQHTESTVEVKSATVLEDRRTNPEHPTQKESE